jgi:nucleoside-diphosphate-sugar epimerase
MFGAEKKYIPARKGEYPFTLCDYSKAKKLLNWVPTKNLKGYIENAKSILKSS